MFLLLTSAVCFFALHRIVSGSSERAVLVRKLGETVFLKLFGIASIICLVGLTAGYVLASDWHNRSSADVTWHYAIQFAAVFLVCAGVLARNPGTVGSSDAVNEPTVVQGILRVTRHPFLWGITLMSASHIVLRPDRATVAYFGTLALLSLTGTVSIDQKRSQKFGRAWEDFRDRTSNVPFLAILQRRQLLRLEEIGWRPLILSIVAFVLIEVAHFAVLRKI